MNPTFKIDMNGASPFQVFDGSGNVMFDARYASIRPEQIGTMVIGSRTNVVSTDGTNAYQEVLLARSRGSKGPLYNIMGYVDGPYFSSAVVMAPPQLWYQPASGVATALTGFWAVGLQDRLRVGNQSYLNSLSVYYSIFSNSAG